MSIFIDEKKCTGCGACQEVCPGNLIRRNREGRAEIRHPEECWGCASCLKECRFGAIFYYLGADIGGRGSLMQVRRDGPLTRWIITRSGQEPVVISVDSRESNKY